MNRTEKHALIALGANLPFGNMPPAGTLRAALAALSAEGIEIALVSEFYATPCYPAGAGPDYVNAAASVILPDKDNVASLLRALHRIEARFGRKRAQRWGMRTLDLDLLAMGDSVLPDAATQTRWRELGPKDQIGQAPDTLILPHPRLQDRAFVLVPLADIAPAWRHPLTGLTVAAMRNALPEGDLAAIRRLEAG
jgi:2-amino-4-hydroxy-6-hydroxymethyldihydropteridine diphosphokinase